MGPKPIGQIVPGESVWAYDFREGCWVAARVEVRHDTIFQGAIVRIGTSLHGAVIASAYHPFWVLSGPELGQRSVPRELAKDEDEGLSLPGRWVNSHELRIGDEILGRDGQRQFVLRLEQWYDDHFEVSNLTVASAHTFAVGPDRILVHNTSGSSIGKKLWYTDSSIIVSDRNLQKIFGKHGSDFGLSGNWNPARANEVRQVILTHINSPSVQHIHGTYRGQNVIHAVDPSTELNVIMDFSGNIIGGWKLIADQLSSVLNGGRLF